MNQLREGQPTSGGRDTTNEVVNESRGKTPRNSRRDTLRAPDTDAIESENELNQAQGNYLFANTPRAEEAPRKSWHRSNNEQVGVPIVNDQESDLRALDNALSDRNVPYDNRYGDEVTAEDGPVEMGEEDDDCQSEVPTAGISNRASRPQPMFEGGADDHDLMGDEIGVEEDLRSDLIGYSSPKAMFNRNVKRGTLYIARKDRKGYFGPVGHNTNQYDLPKEVVCDWEKVTDGSLGFYMRLNRADGSVMNVRYNADNVWFGSQGATFEQFQNVFTGYKLMTMQRDLPWAIQIDTIDIGCQKQIYITELYRLYKEMNKLNANK